MATRHPRHRFMEAHPRCFRQVRFNAAIELMDAARLGAAPMENWAASATRPGDSANKDGNPSLFLRRIRGNHWNLKPVCQLTGLHQRGIFDAVLTRFLLQLNREVRLYRAS